jgi:hypothetical protein
LGSRRDASEDLSMTSAVDKKFAIIRAIRGKKWKNCTKSATAL